MDLKPPKKDFLLLFILILLIFSLYIFDDKTGYIDSMRIKTKLSLVYVQQFQEKLKYILETLKRPQAQPAISNMGPQNAEIYRALLLYYRDRLKQLLELHSLSFDDDYSISRLLKITENGDCLLEVNKVSENSIVVDLKLKKIVGIVKDVQGKYCLAVSPKNKDFLLPVDVKMENGTIIPAIIKGDGKRAFIDVLEDINLSDGEVFISRNSEHFRKLKELDCISIGELIPLPTENDDYRSYEVHFEKPVSPYLLVIGGN